MPTRTARPRRQSRQPASLAELLRAEGAKLCEAPPSDQGKPAVEGAKGDGGAQKEAVETGAPGKGAAHSPPSTKQEALVAALYDKAITGDLAAARLVLAYCEGRPAQVQVNIAPRHPGKTYVVVSPDDWPAGETR